MVAYLMKNTQCGGRAHTRGSAQGFEGVGLGFKEVVPTAWVFSWQHWPSVGKIATRFEDVRVCHTRAA